MRAFVLAVGVMGFLILGPIAKHAEASDAKKDTQELDAERLAEIQRRQRMIEFLKERGVEVFAGFQTGPRLSDGRDLDAEQIKAEWLRYIGVETIHVDIESVSLPDEVTRQIFGSLSGRYLKGKAKRMKRLFVRLGAYNPDEMIAHVPQLLFLSEDRVVEVVSHLANRGLKYPFQFIELNPIILMASDEYVSSGGHLCQGVFH